MKIYARLLCSGVGRFSLHDLKPDNLMYNYLYAFADSVKINGFGGYESGDDGSDRRNCCTAGLVEGKEINDG